MIINIYKFFYIYSNSSKQLGYGNININDDSGNGI